MSEHGKGSAPAERARRANGADPAIACTVRSGAAPAAEHFGPLTSRTNRKEELMIGGQKMVLFVGRLSPEKYPEDVVLCAETIQKE